MHPRSLLSVADLSDAEIQALLERAQGYCDRLESGSFKTNTLKGTSTLLLFYEASTRTRVSFELAGKMLGSDTINVSASGSSAEKGESLRDTALTLAAMRFSAVVLRHASAAALELFARSFDGPVLNAGAGRGEHPTQALLDALTLRQAGLLRDGAHLAIVGDIQHSRVMRSGAALLRRLGLRITLVGPPNLLPEVWAGTVHSPNLPATLHHDGEAADPQPQPPTTAYDYSPDFDAVLPQVDAVMLLRMQRERMNGGEITTLDEFSKLYGLGRRRLALLKPDAVIMHPGPVNRGVELGEDVFRDSRVRINQQVTAGLALRCALLERALERS